MKNTAEDGFKTMDHIWDLPEWLQVSRARENTADQPQAADLNAGMVSLVPALVVIGMVLTVALRALAVFRGEPFNPTGVLVGMIAVGIGGFFAINNRLAQYLAIDIVGFVLDAIRVTPMREMARPAMNVSALLPPMWGGAIALAFIVVMFGLTVILFIEGGWCVVLGGQLALFVIGSFIPGVAGASKAMVARWGGSLFSPVISLGALKLATPIIADVAGHNNPDIYAQLLALAFVLVAWQAPGMVAGAISVSFPGMAQMWVAGRMMGFGRVTPGAAGGGGAGGAGGSGATPTQRSTPPTRGIRGRRPGGGVAATNRPRIV